MYILITGLVVNVVTWDGVSPWSPPSGCGIVKDVAGLANIQDTMTTPGDLTTVVKYVPPPPPTNP